MKPKTMILMVVAVTCGLGASYMTSRLLAERETPEVKKVGYLVAKKELKQGDHLKNPEEWFEMKHVPEGEEPKGAIVSFEQLKDRNVIRSRSVGDFIAMEHLFDSKNGWGPQGTMPEGYRGYGIRVNSESIAGGWASLPNSRVDIVSAVRRTSDKDTYAQILLHDVLVLAADGFTGTPENGKAIMAATVTVAVKPQDALKLALAEQYGPLRLIIRKFNDNSRPDVDKITFENVQNNTVPTDEISEAPTTPAPPTPPTPVAVEPKQEPQPTKVATPVEPVVVAQVNYTKHRVTIIRGDQITYQDYLLDEEGNVVEPGAANNAAPRVPMPQPVPQPVPPQKNDEP